MMPAGPFCVFAVFRGGKLVTPHSFEIRTEAGRPIWSLALGAWDLPPDLWIFPWNFVLEN
jgi:hypothetical protein